MKLAIILALLLAFAFVGTAPAQKWPPKIRGYRVYDAKIDMAKDANLKLVGWQLAGMNMSSATIEVDAEVLSKKQGGRVELVTFSDFTVNGLPVEIEEYSHPFTLKKGIPLQLPKPARISIRMASLPVAAYRELTEGDRDMSIAGTAFVFGKFKKFGLTFKRVVPVKIELKIPNPLSARAAQINRAT